MRQFLISLLFLSFTAHAQQTAAYAPFSFGISLDRTVLFEGGAYQPSPISLEMYVIGSSDSTARNIRIWVVPPDSSKLLPLHPGDSLVRTIDELRPGEYRPLVWEFETPIDTATVDSVMITFQLSHFEPSVHTHPDTLDSHDAWVNFYPGPPPNIGLVSLQLTDMAMTDCNGTPDSIVTATFKMHNNLPDPVEILSIELRKPRSWTFVDGESAIFPVQRELASSEPLEHQWHLLPPPDAWGGSHTFTATINYARYQPTSKSYHLKTPTVLPELYFKPAQEELHLRYNADSGAYEQVPVELNALLSAWLSDFDSMTVKAELVYGAWIFLEFDESTSGLEAEKFFPAMNICDSVDLHWRLNLVKPNDYGSPYEGAIKYTVYNPDSSYFREYIQDVIVDAVNQTAVDDPPAAADMQLSAYPNPFAERTTIRYTLPDRGLVTLKLYDVMGREIRTLNEGLQGPGSDAVTLDAAGLPAGIYFLRLEGPALHRTVQVLRF